MATHTTSPALPGPDYCALPDTEGTWIVKDLLPVSGAMSLYGAPKGGKSHLALQLAHAISGSDPDFLGFPIHRHGRVLYLQLDTPRSLWKARTKDYQHMGLDNRLVYFADREMAPFPFEVVRIDQGQGWLREQCNFIQPLVVIVDVLRNMTMIDEDKSGDMRRAYDSLVSAVQPAAIVLLSHAKKLNLMLSPDDRDNVIQDQRGSSFLPGAVDGIVKLTPKTLMCQSRTMDETRIPITFTPNHLWHLTHPPQIQAAEDAAIEAVLADASLNSTRAKARKLATVTKISEQTARRRLAESQGKHLA